MIISELTTLPELEKYLRSRGVAETSSRIVSGVLRVDLFDASGHWMASGEGQHLHLAYASAGASLEARRNG